MLKISRNQCLSIAAFVVAIPVLIWLKHTGNPLLYLTNLVPNGQGYYVVSKLAALMSILMFGLQAMIGLFEVQFRFAHRFTVHRLVGCCVLLMILIHVSGFIAATTARSGHFTGHFLLPDFGDYYHARITVGLSALILVLSAVFAKIWLSGPLKKWGHFCSLPAFYLSAWHALSIGTESRHPVIQALIILMMALIVVGLIRRGSGRFRLIQKARSG